MSRSECQWMKQFIFVCSNVQCSWRTKFRRIWQSYEMVEASGTRDRMPCRREDSLRNADSGYHFKSRSSICEPYPNWPTSSLACMQNAKGSQISAVASAWECIITIRMLWYDGWEDEKGLTVHIDRVIFVLSNMNPNISCRIKLLLRKDLLLVDIHSQFKQFVRNNATIHWTDIYEVAWNSLV